MIGINHVSVPLIRRLVTRLTVIPRHYDVDLVSVAADSILDHSKALLWYSRLTRATVLARVSSCTALTTNTPSSI